MRIIRIVLLLLILWNLPSMALFAFGSNLGSLLSYATIGLLALYYLLEKKTTFNWWIIIISFLYFTISSFQYYGITNEIILDAIKYFVFVVGGYELVKNVSKSELYVIILIGSLSIAIEALFFTINYGRYSGFYLNPNQAGFMCIYGYSLVFSLKNSNLKLLGQFVFTLLGLLTFSRTFILIWLLLNLISLKISIKNIRILGVGILIFTSLVFIDESIGLNNPRFEEFKNVLSNKKVSGGEISNDSRMDTWSQFYDKIFESPIFGNGYGTFSGKTGYLGVHNTYLMIIGEAGFIPFLLFIGYFGYLFYWSIYFFKTHPYLIMQIIALAVFLLTDHNFFVNYFMTFVAMWIQYQIIAQKKLRHTNETLLRTSSFET